MTELEVLKLEYERAQYEPLFDNPELYSIILNLIQDRLDELDGEV